MASFTITFAHTSGPSTASVTCDGYVQEGPMLTFFLFGPDRDTIDPWSRRVASFRTQDVASVVRHEESATRRRRPGPAAEVPVLVAC